MLWDMTENTTNHTETLTTAGVARECGVDTSTVRRWIQAGQLTPTYTTPGGHHRFDAKDVEAFKGGAK